MAPLSDTSGAAVVLRNFTHSAPLFLFPYFVCSYIGFFVCIMFSLVLCVFDLVCLSGLLISYLCACGLLIPYLCLGSRKWFSVSNKTKLEYFAFLSHITPRTLSPATRRVVCYIFISVTSTSLQAPQQPSETLPLLRPRCTITDISFLPPPSWVPIMRSLRRKLSSTNKERSFFSPFLILHLPSIDPQKVTHKTC